jgi:replicative DNA helicase
MAERIENFRDLNVYLSASELQQEIFNVSQSFPKEELYSLTDQIRKNHTLLEKCMKIGRMLGSMIIKPESFCRQCSI